MFNFNIFFSNKRMVPGWGVCNNPILKSLDSGEPWKKKKILRYFYIKEFLKIKRYKKNELEQHENLTRQSTFYLWKKKDLISRLIFKEMGCVIQSRKNIEALTIKIKNSKWKLKLSELILRKSMIFLRFYEITKTRGLFTGYINNK